MHKMHNQGDRIVSVRVKQPTKIISEYIKHLSWVWHFYGRQDGQMPNGDRLMWPMPEQPPEGRSHYISIQVSCLFVYSSGKFVPVTWKKRSQYLLSWYRKKVDVTCKVASWKHTWIGLQSIALWSRVSNYPSAACCPQHILNENISHLPRCLKTHKRLTVPYTHTLSCFQSEHH